MNDKRQRKQHKRPTETTTRDAAMRALAPAATWWPKLGGAGLFNALLLVGLVAVVVFAGGGITYHVKVFKSFVGEIWTIALCVLFCVHMMWRRAKPLQLPVLVIGYLVFLGAGLVPNLFHNSGYDTLFYLSVHLSLLVGMVVFFNVLEREHLPTVLHSFNALNGVVALACFLEYFGMLQWNGMSAHSDTLVLTFGNRDYLGCYLVMVFPFALAGIFAGESRFAKIGAGVLAGAIFCINLLINSRNAFGGSLLLFVLFIALFYLAIVPGRLRDKLFSKPVLFSMLALILGTAAMLSFNDLLRKALLSSLTFHGLLGTRFLAWLAAVDIFKHSVVSMAFGNGLGSFYQLVFTYYSPEFGYWDAPNSFKHVHNEFLELLADGGIISLLLFLSLLALSFRRLYLQVRSEENILGLRILAAALICSLVGWIFYGLTSISTRMVSTQYLFAFVIIVTWTLIGQRSFRLSGGHKYGAIAALLVLSGLFMTWGTKSFLSEAHHFSSLRYNARAASNKIKQVDSSLAFASTPEQRQHLLGLKQNLSEYISQYEREMDLAFEANPDNIYALYDMAFYTFFAQDLPKFYAVTEHIERIVPLYRNVKELRASALFSQGKFSEAVDEMQRYLATDHYNYDALITQIGYARVAKREGVVYLVLWDLLSRVVRYAAFNDGAPHEAIKVGEGPHAAIRITNGRTKLTKEITLGSFIAGTTVEHPRDFSAFEGAMYFRLGLLLYKHLGAEAFALKFLQKVRNEEASTLVAEHYRKGFERAYQLFQSNPSDKSAMRAMIDNAPHVSSAYLASIGWEEMRIRFLRKLGSFKNLSGE